MRSMSVASRPAPMMSGTLAQPSGAFTWVQAPGGAALVCLPLDAIARHLFTSRSWALGSTRDDAAWDEIACAMEIQPPALVRLRQVHGAAVAVCRAEVHAAVG